jgi:hypothetical protein
MATVDDYASGKLLAEARQVFSLLNASDESLAGSLQGKALLEATSAWDPMLLTPGEAALAIRASTHCAVGERICGPNHPHAPFAEAVFLDELAEALVATRRAEMVTKEQAIATLDKYKKNPKVMCKVSGKPMELCCTSPDTCIYWNMERRGLECIQRKPSGREPTPTP